LGNEKTKRRFKSNLHLLLRHPLVFARVYRWPLLVLLAGSVLDAASTWQILRQYGPQAELHPAGRILGSVLGVSLPVIALGKLLQMLAAVLVASLWRRWCGWLMVLCGALYALAAASNHFGWL